MSAFCEIDRNNDEKYILNLLSENLPLNIYQIGDLDLPYCKHTRWFVDDSGNVATLYRDGVLNVLILLEYVQMKSLIHQLPSEIYFHVHPQLLVELNSFGHISQISRHWKMYLPERKPRYPKHCSYILNDSEEVNTFLGEAYPDSFFNPAMLETGLYRGLREGERLVAMGGVHVVSERFGVAALGNIAVHPDFRGRGLGRAIVEALLSSIPLKIKHIGLNVSDDNSSARRIYESLGFIYIDPYLEVSFLRT